MNDSARVIVCGDACPSGEVEEALVLGDVRRVFNDLLSDLREADYVIANLECPLTVAASPISKDGAVLKAHPAVLKGLTSAGIKAFGLANNHILDHGPAGLKSTIESLDDAGLCHFGAGAKLCEAMRPHVVEINNVKLAFFAIAEHEFSIAGVKDYGANPLDIISNARAIRDVRSSVDHVIVLFHGGKEHYKYPTPNQQKFSRFLIEEGASVVVSQHSHIIGTYEEYEGGLIVYGQGNFLFGKVSRNYESWMRGVLIELHFRKDGFTYKWHPFYQDGNSSGVKRLPASEADNLLREFERNSENVSDIDFIRESWRSLCRSEQRLYKSRLLGHNRYMRVMNRIFDFARWIYSRDKLNMIRNVVECETHREGLETLWNDRDIKF